MPESVAMVIPTWNEAGQLDLLWKNIHPQLVAGDEVFLADAGSDDGTVDHALALGFQVHECIRRGRGCQIAEALTRINSDIVIVLHADTHLQEGSVAAIRRSMEQDPRPPGGCLGHRFDRRHWLLKVTEWGDDLRVRFCRKSLGDQVQFFRKSLLDTVGGFPAQPLMEDVELARRLNQLGRPAYLNIPATTSARRFDRLGIWNTLKRNAGLRRRYARLGPDSAESLFREYYAEDSAPKPRI